MNNVGLTITEGVARGATPYTGPSKRNIGLLGGFIRGAAFTPTKVTSMEDVNTIFGGLSSSFYGPAIVKSIFDEAGEAKVTLYLARAVSETSQTATGEVSIGDSSAKMTGTAAYKGNPDPGAWGNKVTLTLYSYGYKVKDAFTLTISYNGGTPESYSYDTLAKIQDAVNKVSKYATVVFSKEIEKLTFKEISGTVTTTTASKEVTGVGTTFTSLKPGNVLYNETNEIVGTIAEIKSDTSILLTSKAFVAVTAGTIKARDDKEFSITLAEGVDGELSESDFYPGGDSINATGIKCFDGYDVQILGVTEFHSLSMAKVLNQYLQEVKGPVGIINLPLNADEGTAELYALELQTNGISYMAGAYMGWAKVPDENGDAILIPVMGPVLGAAYIRTPYIQGDFIHIPPGGSDSIFNNVLDMVPQRLSQTVINKLVQQYSCNVIQYVERLGFYVGSSRTYSTNSLYSSIHVRLQTSYYRQSLNAKLRFAEQKPNTPELKREILVECSTFFKTEYDNGALERSVPFDTAYTGICDKSNNPVTQDRKLLNVDILWIPTECTESIHLSLQRNDGVLTTNEEE